MDDSERDWWVKDIKDLKQQLEEKDKQIERALDCWRSEHAAADSAEKEFEWLAATGGNVAIQDVMAAWARFHATRTAITEITKHKANCDT